MYLFSFKKYAGHDRVFFSSKAIGNPGDLLQTEDDFLLNLGEEISFQELYHHQLSPQEMKVVSPGFFDQHVLSFLHWMVYERYSNYKSVIKYFVSMEVQQLLMRESKAKKKNWSGASKWLEASFKQQNIDISLPPKGQTLLIIPDNRTRHNLFPSAFLESPEVINLLSLDTQNKKDQHWRAIKNGARGPIIATQSEVFQPFIDLTTIVIFDPHKWYYHNQQEPRYSIPTVVKKMEEIYWAEAVEVSNIWLL